MPGRGYLGPAEVPTEVPMDGHARLRARGGLMNAEVVVLLRPLDTFPRESCGPLSGESTEPRMSSPPQPNPSESKPETSALSPREAFDTALGEHRDELLHYLRKRLGDRELAADLAQETLSRMMKYRNAGDIEDHRQMLFRIANNLIFEHHRTRQRHHAGDHHSLDDTGPLRSSEPPVEAIVDARQAIDILLKRTIGDLPPKCRLAFMLSRFDGLSYPQIADRMGISVKMVEKHITKALLACRAAVGDRDF